VYGQPNFLSEAPVSPASAQTLSAPQGIFVDNSSTLYIADSGNNRVVAFTNTPNAPAAGASAAFVIGQNTFDSVVIGGGAAGFRQPADVGVDSQGDIVVSDYGNSRVLIFSPLIFLPLSGAPASAVVGQRDFNSATANWNSPDGLATPEGLYGPIGLFVDRQDTLYVGDAGNSRVLHYLKPATAMHVANAQTGIPLARGGLVSVSGSGFSGDSANASGSPWPLALGGREVVFNDQVRAPLSSVTDSQIKLQVPGSAAAGTVRIAVRVADTAELVAGSTVVVADVSPGLFSGSDTKNMGVQNFDGSPNSASNPALRGSTIKIFGTGQGPVSPSIGDGVAAPNDSMSTVAVPTSNGTTCLTSQPSVCVAIGTTFGDIQFSGLAPGLVGTWQLTVKIPVTVTPGTAVPLRAMINGVPSNIVNVALK
jgi:uncharacterized protein (TIGR03437 family)